MAFDLTDLLKKVIRKAGWKIKIRDNERNETPHVTILSRETTWRVSLRDGSFLHPGGRWKDIPKEVQAIIEDPKHRERLAEEWDAMYPENPVWSDDEDV